MNFSKTERIVLIIDLHPLLHHPNPNSYLSSLLTSVKLLLSFPPLSLSLSSYKLFFSSLSPLLSSSSLNLPLSTYNPNFLSFNSPNETLASLSKTLNSFRDLLDPSNSSVHGSIPKAEFVSSSVAQLIHDYSWDLSCDNNNSDFLGFVRSNLVVLFSPICRSFIDLRDFMGVSDSDGFSEKFRGVFGSVRDGFVSRDIHFSWVVVRCDDDVDVEKINVAVDDDERGRLVGLFRDGVRSLGWGFCSSDSIVLGSAVVSFGLIYPMIGMKSSCCRSNYGSKKLSGQLSLEIVGVSGEPMECKYCDVELFDLRMSRGRRRRLDGISIFEENEKVEVGVCQERCGVWESWGDGVVKIDVKAVYRHDEVVGIDEQISDVVLVEEWLVDSKKKKEELLGEFFADRVLDLLSKETGKLERNSQPLWQILLSFLYRKGYWALLHLSNASGCTTMGVLKPFTIHSAFLCILKSNTDVQFGEQIGVSELNLGQCKSETGDEKRRQRRKHPRRYKDLSWRSFCKAAYELCEMELEEAYLSKGCDSSKKLRFFKCWMKQVVKNSSSPPCNRNTPRIVEISKEGLGQLNQDSQLSLVGEHAVKELPQTEEAAEAFFSNLSQRIQHGIVSGVDLVSFARRIVRSCIHWLKLKLAPDTRDQSRASLEKLDGSSYGGLVVGELIKLLLIDPKSIAGKYKDGNLSSKDPDARSSNISSEDRVREYELQILFRMEILQSEIVTGIKDSAKHKFIKQICCLLELIQCNMEDGFFGDFNLNDYVGKTIRSRYSQKLGDVVHRICDQMDLLLFDDNNEESPNLLLNSEDSGQSWRIGDNDSKSEPNSTDDSLHNASTDHGRKLVEAQERRARALRFASFSRRGMPELQRVWGPKPPKISRSKSDSFRRSKRKIRHRESSDKVCETPPSGTKKCLFPSGGSVGDEEFNKEQDGCSTGSIHRALFQDESWHDDWGL